MDPGRGGAEARQRHLVLVVPDLFACMLRDDEGLVWAAAEAIAAGRLGSLRLQPNLADSTPTVGGPIDPLTTAALEADLDGQAEVELVAYDWRLGVAGAADALARAIERRRRLDPSGEQSISVIAHGLGALGAVAALSATPHAIEALGDGRLVLVAPPLEGAGAILELALARGPVFAMLERLDATRSASGVLRIFLRLPGVVDLLPTAALDPDWWDRLALTAPPAPLLQAAEATRKRLRTASLPADRVSVVLGSATDTPSIEAGEDDEPRVERHADGDGWLRPQSAWGGGERAVWVPVPHERLLANRTSARVLAELALTPRSAHGLTGPPQTPPVRSLSVVEHPTQEDLVAVLTATEAGGLGAAPSRLRVEVAHGSLDRLRLPVAVGHYIGDAIVGAEAFLDRCLDGRLGARHRLGDYPGEVGSTLVLQTPRLNPPGALVIGLGEVGELTASALTLGVKAAVVRYALAEIDRRRESAQPGDGAGIGIASLLVGTRGGRQLSVRQAILATVRGVLAAKRVLAREGFEEETPVDRLVFVELWSDIAVAAGHTLAGLDKDPSLGLLPSESLDLGSTLRIIEGGRRNRPLSGQSWSWWRRLVITESDDQGLRFLSLSERARAEDRLVSAHRMLVDELLERAPRSISDVEQGSVVNALFELLLPVALKESVFDGNQLVLVVDSATSRYPWELLARRKGSDIEPLVTRVQLIRQLKSQDFREIVVPARGDHALVIGEPSVPDVAPLPAAAAEGREVATVLAGGKGRFEVVDSIEESGVDVVQKLFLSDYRIVHIAAHGVFDADDSEQSGVVIGSTRVDGQVRLRVLSADVFAQLRTVPEVVFLNCCHLAKTGSTPTGPALAASVAETLIGLGVRCFVAAGWAVNDRAGLTFARVFYEHLLDGRSFGASVHAARLAVWARHRRTTTWGAYQCYGDPAFRLRKPSAARGGRRAPSFVSETEVHAAVADIRAKAMSTGSSSEELGEVRSRLRAIEAVLDEHPAWRRGGDLLYTLAEAWKLAGEPEKAIDLYRRSLESWNGLAPLRAAEQLANLLDRFGRGRLAEDRRAPIENKAGTRSLPRAWIDWADGVGATPERAALRGASFKRLALRTHGAVRRRALEDAVAAYSEAIAMYREAAATAADTVPGETDRTAWAHGHGMPFHQGLQAVAAVWAYDDPASLADAPVWLAGCRASAEADRERNGDTLWNRLGLLDVELLDALIHRRLDIAAAGDLADRYRRVLGTLGSVDDHVVARKQIDFLIQLDRDDRFAEPLAIVRAAFRNQED